MSSANDSSALLWLHEDCLSPTAPPFVHYPTAPAIFVWDEPVNWSLKRILFVYECLLELPVEIERGDPVEVLHTYAKKLGAARIVTQRSPSPRFAEIRKSLTLPVEVLEPVPFVELSGQVDLKRFSRYWRRAQSSAFLPTRARP